MRLYQPLILQKLHIRVPGFHIRQFALHKHLPETTDIQLHQHAFSQLLLYLSGQGVQRIEGHSFKIRAGSLVFLPPGVEHAFHREANRRPVALALDFDWKGATGQKPRVSSLSSATLRDARQIISRISHLHTGQMGESSIHVSVEILKLMALLAHALGLVTPAKAQSSPVIRKVEMLLNAPDCANASLRTLAQRSGHQQDHLNRLLKRQSGLTLGQLKSRNLLQKAQKLLRQPSLISDVSGVLGFNDPNYFSRWFRKQTNVSPRAWRKENTTA
jgi:AraC family transcriptional regulator, transcriptional activator of pobA